MEPTNLTGSRGPHRGGLFAFVAGAAAILASLPFTWFLHDGAVRDEAGGRTGGHLAVVRQWIAHPESISIANFPEPKGPGLFAAAAWWGRIFGTSSPALRSLVVVCAIALLAAWAWLVHLWDLRRPLAVGISLLAVPYCFIYTQMLHTEIPALLLAVLGLACATKLARTGALPWAIGLTLTLGASLWVRQTFLIVPAAIIVCSPWMGRYRLRLALAAAAACLAIVPMICLWGELVPPGDVQRFTPPGDVQPGHRVYPDVFAYALGVLGVMGWPALLVRPTGQKKHEWIFFAIGAGLALVMTASLPLDYSSPDRMGLLQKALISIPMSDWVLRAVLRACVCVGGFVLARLVCFAVTPAEPAWIRFGAVLAAMAMGLCLVASPIFYDRYLILALVVIFAIAAERSRPAAAWGFLCFFAAVAIAHAVYVTHVPQPAAFGQPIWGPPTTSSATAASLQAPTTKPANTGL